ncbi:uncharacterized protein V1510DRAFT_383827 [Dipodascopsis tothii]|uniref:uncharacterized protein n=1 Tax=Dipodascopsis tothii TaxID=44089 RepID=UPI0034CEA8AF
MSTPALCPVPPYSTGDETSFGHTSARSRWPIIITGVVDDLHRSAADATGAKAEEGRKLIEAFGALKHEVSHDRTLEPLEDDGGEDIAVYNAELARQGPMSYGNAPWLYSECYLYRKMYLLLQKTEHWKDYDIYGRQKMDAFVQSGRAVSEIAVRYKGLAGQLDGVSPEQLELLFREFVDISLWGNATDLSLLTSLSLEQLQSLQGEKARKESEKYILANDVEAAFAAVKAAPGGGIDIVLDNAGFEFYTDLILGLFVLDSKLASTVTFHTKRMPWFVSDVIPADFDLLVDALASPADFPDHRPELDFLVDKLKKYHAAGSLVITTSPFWTTSLPFWEIREGGLGGGDAVRSELLSSKCVFFKGDLNYRKLTYDSAWPTTTPFKTALGTLATSGVKVMSLRTCKADVVVGLPAGKSDELEAAWIAETTAKGKPQVGKAWCWTGRWAVMQFSDGL